MGRAFFKGWRRRTRLAETRRPTMVKLLAVFTAAGGLLLVAEGVVTGFFLPHVTPFGWDVDFFTGRAPWISYPRWLAAACLILIGLAGLFAAIVMPRRGQLGAYFALFMYAGLVVTGVVMLVSGVRFAGAWMTVFGSVNLGAALCLALMLGLSWYTLDPLGLHGEPPP